MLSPLEAFFEAFGNVMAELSLEFEGADKVDAFLQAFPAQAATAILRALKRGTDSTATDAGRVASKDMGLKVGVVRKRLRKVAPNGRTLFGEVRASLARMRLIEFGARGREPSRGRGRGVTYRGGRRGSQRHTKAFITKVGSHRGVFERRGSDRLPIAELFGPSVGRVVAEHDEDIARRGSKVYEQELFRLLDRVIAGVRIAG